MMAFSSLPFGLGARLRGAPSGAYVVDPSNPPMPTAPLNPNAAALLAPSAPPLRARLGAALRGLGTTLNPYGGGIESFASGLSGGYGGTADATEQARLAPLLFQQGQEDRNLRLAQVQAGIAADVARGHYYDSKAERPNVPPAPLTRQMDGRTMQYDPTTQTWGYVTPTGTPPPREVRPGTPPRPRAPQLRVGEDGFQWQLNPRTNRWEHSLDASGQPFKPRQSTGRGAPLDAPGAGLTPRGTGVPATPRNAGESDADYWERLTQGGMTADAATAYVRSHP